MNVDYPYAQRYAHQGTVLVSIHLEGVGVHSGEGSTLIIRPAPADTGIVFVREGQTTALPAKIENLHSGHYCTAINASGWHLFTVEHLLAAFQGIGLTNAFVSVSGGHELPIFDGSALPIVEKIMETGVDQQKEETSWLTILSPIRIEEEERWIEVSPSPHPLFHVTVATGAQGQEESYTFSPLHDDFQKVLAPARTFAHLREIEKMRQAGFIKGGTLDCAIVIHEGKTINPGGLRFDNECARHKVLDLWGDLALLGGLVWGQVRGYGSGHSLNHRLMMALMANPTTWELRPASQMMGRLG